MDRHARFGAIEQRPDQIIDDECFGAEVDGNQCLVLTIHLLLAGVRNARSMTRVMNGHDVAGHGRIDQRLVRSHNRVERRLLIGQHGDLKLSVCKKLGPLLGVVHAPHPTGCGPGRHQSRCTKLVTDSWRSPAVSVLSIRFHRASSGVVPRSSLRKNVGRALLLVCFRGVRRARVPVLHLEPCPKSRSQNRVGSCPRVTPPTNINVHAGHRMKRFSRRSLDHPGRRFAEHFSQLLTLFTEPSTVLHNRQLSCCPV